MLYMDKIQRADVGAPAAARGRGGGVKETGPDMRGIILAAGKGSRLNGTIGDKPKCLLRVGGKTLVERQIEALKAVGITDIAVVVGCQAEAVRRSLRRPDHLRRELALRADQQPLLAVAGTTSAI